MTRTEEVAHFRSYFRQCGHDEAMKIKMVAQIRDVALEYLSPAVIAKVPAPYYSDEVRAAYAAKGISLEWNLSIRGDTGVNTFCFVAARDAGLTPSQQSAARLLDYCTEAIDKNAVTERLQQWILDAYAGLDGDAINRSHAVIAGSDNARAARARGYDPEKELWRDTAKSILAGRKNKPGARELARLVGTKLNQLDKADSRRKWIADLC